jgi:ATP-dependent protease HslVU (ClpYQ) ATPase subunit
MNNKIINEIFTNINADNPLFKELEKRTADEIMEVLQEAEAAIPEEYHDLIETKTLEASCLAERNGFEAGMKYMCRLLMECLS